MVNEKHLFALMVVAMLGFVAYMVFGNSTKSYADMPIDESIPISTGNGQVGGGELQTVSVRALPSGVYDKPTVTVKAGQPVRFDFTAEPGSGCGAQLIIDKVGVNLVSRNGQTVSATFTPPSPGQYPYHCGMNMFRGVLVAN